MSDHYWLEQIWLRLNHLTETILAAGEAGRTPWCYPTTSASQRVNAGLKLHRAPE